MVTTAGDEEQANHIARELVARRHAACVNMLPGVKSFYRWQGKICHDSEWMLIIKTSKSEYDAVEATIQELHSYDQPEILAFHVARGEAGFLDWITQCLDKDAAFDNEGEMVDLDES